jgi:hypothetical protein
MAADLVVLGVASSADSHHAVRDLAPYALRRAGVLGVTVADPALAAPVLAEVNPGHDPGGREAFR